jgi:predicted aminopeptidase
MRTMLTESFAQTLLAASAARMRPVTAMRAVAAGAALVLLSGCGTTYIAQAARGEWQVLHARRPIATVMSDPRSPASLRDRLAAVQDARDFASRKLGLPDNKSYRAYADLGRRYVVWNVVAAPEFSIEPQQWCFPIAGCVAYRGYFAERKADSFAARLRKQSFDVVVQGVPAYSTLGRFADPVLNTMLIYGDDELAAIVFHELAHQLIYVEGDSEFNEAFAVSVEETGLARWLEFTGRKAELDGHRAEHARDVAFNTLFARRRDELARLYRQKLPLEVMREKKRLQFAQLADDMRDLARREGVHSGYEEWIASGLNNAYLASVATYFDCVAGFERLLVEQNGELPRFYAAVRTLAHAPLAQRHRELCATSAQRNQ